MLIDVFVIYLSPHGLFEASFYEITSGRRLLMEKSADVGVWWVHKNIIEPKGWLRHVLSPHNQNPPYPSSLPGDDDRPWRFPFLPACAVLFNVTGGLWASGVIECSVNVNTLARPMWKGEEFVWNKGRCECFLKALSRKLSGFHVRYRFKRKPYEPRADHPSSVLTYMKHLGKSEKSVEIMDGTLTELLSLNASWSEILVKGNIPCNRRQTKSEDKIRSQASYEQK